MSNQHKNSLEDLFKSRLAKQREDKNGWNIPPDEVFEQAMETISGQNNKDNRRKYFILFFIGIGILIISAFYFSNHNINQINQKLSTLENNLKNSDSSKSNQSILTPSAKSIDEKDLNSKQEKINTSVINSNQTQSVSQPLNNGSFDSKIKEKTSNLSPISNSNNINNSFKKAKPTLPKDNKLIQTSPPANFILNNEIKRAIADNLSTSQGSLLTDDKNTSTSNSNNDVIERNLSSLNLTPALNFVPVFTNQLSTIDASFAEKNQALSKQNKVSIGVFVLTNFTSLDMTNVNFLNNESLTKYDQYYCGHGLGLSLNYHLNPKWSVQLASSFEFIKNKSVFTQEFIFDENNAQIIDNELMNYPMEFNIMTPIGSYSTQADISLRSSEIEDGDLMNNIWDINQTIRVINLSTSIKYNFFQNDRWNIYAGLGLGSHFIQRVNHDLNNTIISNDIKMMDVDMKPGKLTDTKSNYFTLQTFIGVERKLSKTFSLQFQAKYQHSLNSLTKQNDQLSPASFLTVLGTEIGIQYNF